MEEALKDKMILVFFLDILTKMEKRSVIKVQVKKFHKNENHTSQTGVSLSDC